MIQAGSPDGGAGHRDLHAYLDNHQNRRQGNKILHGYPPPLLWRERDIPVDRVMALRAATAVEAPKRLNVYVGLPYCLATEPDRCGFCIFPSEVYRSQSQLDDFLGSLRREGEMYRPYVEGAPLGSIYLGGGTANLLRASAYSGVLDLVRDVLGGVESDTEITLEGVPQLFTRDKLQAMREAGINRISIGAQQLGTEMIEISGRRQTAEQVLASIEWCHELGLPCSVDLIFGWPRQNVAHLVSDLETLAATGIGHLTLYELNLAGRTDFALRRAHELPSRAENLEMYRVARDMLVAAGFRQVTAYDWERRDAALPGAYRFEQSWHRPLAVDPEGAFHGFDMWGWGFAGVSSFQGVPGRPGWTYMNWTRVAEYAAILAAGRFPIERGYRYSESDLRLNTLFQMLQAMAVDLEEYRTLFGVDLVTEHEDLWQTLVERGWVEISDRHLRLVGDGAFHTPLIQGVLAREQRHHRGPA